MTHENLLSEWTLRRGHHVRTGTAAEELSAQKRAVLEEDGSVGRWRAGEERPLAYRARSGNGKSSDDRHDGHERRRIDAQFRVANGGNCLVVRLGNLLAAIARAQLRACARFFCPVSRGPAAARRDDAPHHSAEQRIAAERRDGPGDEHGREQSEDPKSSHSCRQHTLAPPSTPPTAHLSKLRFTSHHA